jgi:hypothetical protein
VKKQETLAQMSARQAREIAAAGAATEAEMRAAPEAHPKSIAELSAYVEALAKRPHDYGTCVYAMSLAAVAAFNYIASQLRVTGFQASCADLDVIRRTRGLEHPFAILNAGDLLYPQMDPLGQAAEFLDEVRPTLAPAARKLLASAESAHPDVRRRWREISELGQ